MKKFLILIFTLTATLTHAQNIFQDNFFAYTSGARLTGQGTWSNNSSTGFPGGGSCSPFATCGATVEDFSMSYTGYGSSSKAVTTSPDKDNAGTFFPVVTSGELYLGLVINLTSAPASPVDFYRILNNGPFNTAFRIIVTPISSSTFSIGIRKGDTSHFTAYTTTAYSYNQNHLLILRYTTNPGTNDDELRLYVDPVYTNGEPVSPSAITALPDTFGDTSGNIDRMFFRQNATTVPTGKIGLISVARTWETLSFNLSNNEFNRNTFTISSNEVNNGVLNIKSGITLENAILSIYEIQGRKIDNKTISLEENINDIAINPIHNSGVYIVEITSGNNQRFTQKIVVK